MSVHGHQKSPSTGRFTEHFDNVIAVPVETTNNRQSISRGLSLRRNNNRNSLPPTAESDGPPSNIPTNAEPASPLAPLPQQRLSQLPPPVSNPPQQLQRNPSQQQQTVQMPLVAEPGELNKRNSRGPLPPPGMKHGNSNAVEPPPVFRPPQQKSNSMSRRSGSIGRSGTGGFSSNADGINPSEVLISRLDAWRVMIKMFIEYFDEIAKAEVQMARNYIRLSGIIQLPIREGHFKEDNGIQDVCVAFRDGSKSVSEDHDDFAKFILENILPSLIRIKKKIKDRMREMKNDEGLHLDTLWKEMDQTKKAMAFLDKQCAVAKLQQPSQQISQDPWLANLRKYGGEKELCHSAHVELFSFSKFSPTFYSLVFSDVMHQLKQQIEEENRLHERMIALQREVATFEGSIVDSTKSAMRTFYDRRAKDIYSHSTSVESIIYVLDNLKLDTEWHEFVSKHGDQLVREDAGFRNYRDIDYPNKHDPLVQAIKKGKLSRKTGVMRSYNERYYALTPCGYLHEFRPEDKLDPELSIYIPNTTVTLLEPTKGGYGFEIHGRNTVGMMNRERTYTLRAASSEEQNEWYQQLQILANRPPPGPAPVPAGVPMDVKTFDIDPPNHDHQTYPPQNYHEMRPQASTDTKHLVSEPTMTDSSANNHVQFDDDSILSSPINSPPKSPIPAAEHHVSFDSDSDISYEEASPVPSNIVRQNPPLASPKPKHAYIGGFKPMLQGRQPSDISAGPESGPTSPR
jgi:PH domain